MGSERRPPSPRPQIPYCAIRFIGSRTTTRRGPDWSLTPENIFKYPGSVAIYSTDGSKNSTRQEPKSEAPQPPSGVRGRRTSLTRLATGISPSVRIGATVVASSGAVACCTRRMNDTTPTTAEPTQSHPSRSGWCQTYRLNDKCGNPDMLGGDA